MPKNIALLSLKGLMLFTPLGLNLLLPIVASHMQMCILWNNGLGLGCGKK